MSTGGENSDATTAELQARVSARIDRLPASRHIWMSVVLVSFGAFFEIYDIFLTAPLSLGLKSAGIFHMGSAGLFGLTDQATFIAATFTGLYLGTIGFSAIADRFGRRVIFTWALVHYSIATFIMGFQSNAFWIDFWRLIAGIGVGTELVAIDCYLSELCPKSIRGKAFALSQSIQFLSAPAVGLLAWLLIPGDFLGVAGWRWLCFLPAIAAIAVWFVRLGLPESPRWLASHGHGDEAEAVIARIEARVQAETGAPLPAVDSYPAPAVIHGQGSYRDLWRDGLATRTNFMIVFQIFQVIGFYGFVNWLPTLLVAKGIVITKSLGYSVAITLASPLGPLMFTTIAETFERKWQIVCGALFAAIFGFVFSSLSKDSLAAFFIVAGLGISLSSNLMSYSYHAYQSEIYPTRIRARAVGFVYSFSRLSAIFSGYMIAAILGGFGATGVFVFISIAMAIAALAVGLFGPRTNNRSLEEITAAAPTPAVT